MTQPLLRVEGLSARAGGRIILRRIDLSVAAGETLVLFGPNGSGKTTLLFAIFGFPGVEVLEGKVILRGEDVTSLPPDQRARMGMGMAFQRPPSVRGVHLGDVVRTSLRRRGREPSEADSLLDSLNLRGFAGRDLNLGFSGGEIKRSELVQLLAQEPDLVMFDEPDSGVDLVSVTAVGQVMRRLLEKDLPRELRGRGGLVITHGGHILDHVEADRGCVLLEGTLHCTGDPAELLNDIRSRGYEGCVKCREGF